MDQPTPVQPTAPPPQQPPSGGSAPQNPLFVFDQKTIQTIQWSAIASAIAAAVTSIASYLAVRMAARAAAAKLSSAYLGGALGNFVSESIARSNVVAFSPRDFIGDLIWGAVYGAIGGWVLAKFFPVFLNWNRQFLKGKLDTFFKLLFVPTVLGAILLALFGSAMSVVTGFGAWAITIIGMLVAQFIYAKVMDIRIGRLYPMR